MREEIDRHLNDLAGTVSEMLESAARVKGAPFANAAAGVFELMQAAEAVGSMATCGESAGLDLHPAAQSATSLIGIAASRLTADIADIDVEELRTLVRQLMAQRATATSTVFAGLRSEQRAQQH